MPRHDVYWDAAVVLRRMDSERRGLRDIFYDDSRSKQLKFDPAHVKTTFALLCRCIKLLKSLKKFLSSDTKLFSSYTWDGSISADARALASANADLFKDASNEAHDVMTPKVSTGWSKKSFLKSKLTQLKHAEIPMLPYLFLIMSYDEFLGHGSPMKSSRLQSTTLFQRKLDMLKSALTNTADPILKAALAEKVPSKCRVYNCPLYLRIQRTEIDMKSALKSLEASCAVRSERSNGRNGSDENRNGGAQRKLTKVPFCEGFLRLDDTSLARNLASNELIQKGAVSFQDIACGLAVDAAELKPGYFVIDCCAAPGGKTLLAIDRLRNSGRIIAIEKDEQRFNAMCSRISAGLAGPFKCPFCRVPIEEKQSVKVVGHVAKKRKSLHQKALHSTQQQTKSNCSETITHYYTSKNFDASAPIGAANGLIVALIRGDLMEMDSQTLMTFPQCCAGSEAAKMAPNTVNAVFVDPSCTGTGLPGNYGVIASYDSSKNSRLEEERNPGAGNKVEQADFRRLLSRAQAVQDFQLKILRFAMSTLGDPASLAKVVYSTCSVLPQENELVLQAALEGCGGGWKLQRVPQKWSEMLLRQDTTLDAYAETYSLRVPLSERSKVASLFSECFHTDPAFSQCKGFFMAKLHRTK